MSRLTGLLRRVGQVNLSLAQELDSEMKALAARRCFGLNFERHVPENVELPHRKVRRGDKVRVRIPHGDSGEDTSGQLWLVTRIERSGDERTAQLIEWQPSGNPETAQAKVEHLVVVAEFRDPIYPGLKSTGRIECGNEDDPFHIVINAENYLALEALVFAYEGKIDCIYIDPPYNTRDKDWKYNNDYVDSDDGYKHSKWLAMMERRLKLAKLLLDPSESVLLITIDDNEMHRLGLLLDQIFSGYKRQLISITTSPRGKSRATEFSQVNEYMFVVYVGQARMTVPKGTGDEAEVRWRYLRRNDIDSARGTVKGGPQQFYPIYVDNSSGKIVKIGEALSPEDSVDNVPSIKGATPVFPIREDGEDMNWGLTGPSLAKALSNGYVRVTPGVNANQPYTFAYLTAPNIKKVETNELLVTGLRKDGSKIVVVRGGKVDRPTTVWRDTRYDAGAYGTAMLGDLIPGRKFPFPKSLYAVEDALRFFVNDKPHALVLDFFAGSGTTSHAVMRLNKQDGGRRQCILVTNNEVSADEAVALHAKGHESGDPEWEALGICEYITKPRLKAAITGLTPDGEQVDGTYRSPDQFPMSDGFEQNAEFFELTYEDVELVRLNMKFHAIAPFLWMKVGSQGRRIDEPTGTFDISDTYAVLFNVDAALDFLKASTKASTLRTAFIITDDEKQFQMIADELPHRVEAVRLYDSYISTLRVNVDRG